MRIAVTGATGFVGREISRSLEEAGHDVVPITRHASGLRNEAVVGPIEDADTGTLVAGLRDVDAVAHLAALTHVQSGQDDAREAFQRVNVQGTQRLLDAVAAAGVPRVVYMSSVKVNGEETLPGRRFSGIDVPAPEDEYGRTKHAAEQLVVAAGIETVVLRPPMVYGAGVGGNFARLVAAVRRGLPLPLKRVNNRRSLISVCNLADATICALTRADANGAVVTLSDGVDHSTAALVTAIGDAVGRPARLIPVPVAALKLAGAVTGKGEEVRRIVGNLQVDNDAACAALHWTPRDRLAPALHRMLGSGA